MFCAGCGSQIQSGLNYCNRCGRRVADDSNAGRSSSLSVVGQTAGVGFVSFIFILLVLTKYGALPPNLLVPITFFYFAALFGICFMILRHGTPASAKSEGQRSENIASGEPAYLRPVTTAQLEEERDFGIGSVTDATTRTLDKVPSRDP